MSDKNIQTVAPGASHPATDPGTHDESDFRWRQRAVEAEENLRTKEEDLSRRDRELAESRERVRAIERRAEVERELMKAETLDLEAAAAVVESAIRGAEKPDVAGVVRDLRRRKPHLFRARPVGRLSAMGGEPGPASPLDRAFEAARGSGDRRALMKYLRLRRGV